MSYTITNNKIVMTRGDTVKAEIGIVKRSGGGTYTPQAGDVIRFSVKARLNDRTPLLEKVIPHESMLLEIDPQETKNLPFGTYHYEVSLTYENGDVDTFITDSQLVLTTEIN